MGKSLRQLKGVSMLLLAALIWGTAFVAQSMGMDYIGPCTFNAVRSFIGSVVLVPVIFVMARWKARNTESTESPPQEGASGKKTLFFSGLACGVLLCGGSLLQQVGLQYTTAGKAGFLTALYIVIVPVLGIFLGRRPGLKVWLGVGVALAGTYLLSFRGDFSIGTGDLLVILSALFFSLHILLVDRISGKVDGIRLSCIQFLVSGVISLGFALGFETIDFEGILAAWGPLLYTGVLSSGVAYTLQILGQRGTNPTVACLILSLESVFAAVAGWLILGQALSLQETMGCILVFVAVILAQLPSFKKKKDI